MVKSMNGKPFVGGNAFILESCLKVERQRSGLCAEDANKVVLSVSRLIYEGILCQFNAFYLVF